MTDVPIEDGPADKINNDRRWEIKGNNINIWGKFRGDLSKVAHDARVEFDEFAKEAAKEANIAKNAAADVLKRAAGMFHKLDDALQRGMSPARFYVDADRIGDYLKASLAAIANESLRKLAQSLLERSMKMLKDIAGEALKALKFAV